MCTSRLHEEGPQTLQQSEEEGHLGHRQGTGREISGKGQGRHRDVVDLHPPFLACGLARDGCHQEDGVGPPRR
jgi:hypothetical protein